MAGVDSVVVVVVAEKSHVSTLTFMLMELTHPWGLILMCLASNGWGNSCCTGTEGSVEPWNSYNKKE